MIEFMEQYINKSALVAEIEKHKVIWDGMDGDYCKGQRLAYSDMLSFIDAIETKEVDLKKEIENYLSSYWPNEKELYPFLGHMAKQFFELGMQVRNKAQKGEEV